MAHAYTPGLKVIAEAVVRKHRVLPLPGEVTAAVGDRVSASDVVARTFLPGRVEPLNLAGRLGVPPEDIESFLEVEPRAEVERGQVLARTKGLFGLFRSEVTAPTGGVLESVSTRTGQAMLREPPVPLEVSAYIRGRIEEVIEGEGVTVLTAGSLVQGIFGIGGERHGPVRVAVDRPEAELAPEAIGADLRGAVIIGGKSAPLAAYRRATEVGAAALVVGAISDLDMRGILGYDLGVAITGEEALETTLIATEGFGEIPMAERTFALLSSLEGREASVNGATQIRAGVLRPEIIVPSEADPRAIDAERTDGGKMEIGTRVRIIREPDFGALAEVAELPAAPVRIATEAEVRVVRVRLRSGEERLLPRANVERIEDG